MKSCLVAAIFCAVLLASFAPAQQTGASVSGTVTDPSGAHIVGVTVTALNMDTGVPTTVTTNDAGVYTMPSLLPGHYQLTAEHSGFRKAVINGVLLEVGGVLTLNMPLELGQTTETVEVQARAIAVNETSASVGEVVEGQRLLDLPLVARSAYDLVQTQPGVLISGFINGSGGIFINGQANTFVNFTFDGIVAMDNIHDSAFFVYTNVATVDRVEEFRVVTSPADAEYGRGVGQVQMVTRAGTNKYAGSAWEELRNGDLNTNSWFSNAAGHNANGTPLDPRIPLKQNNYGIRFGGPIPKTNHKFFFNGIYEPFKQRNVNTVDRTVYTQSALQGIFRFYPGVVNGNITAAVPTVDQNGNPLQPASATGGLQSVSVLGRDPNRLTPDSTGAVAKDMSYIPLPNNYLVGDGLNTAGFAWSYPEPQNFELYEGRIDEVINEKERLYITLSQQSLHNYNYTQPSVYPTVPGEFNITETTNYLVALTSVFRPNLLNDLRIGVYRTRTIVGAPYSQGNPGFTGFLPNIDNYPAILYLAGETSSYAVGAVGDYLNPNYQYGDNLTWIKGKHSFKGGAQVRFISFAGYDFGYDNNVPYVILGAPVLTPVTNISTGANPIPGIGQNATTAANLLYDLTGSVSGTSGVTQNSFATGGKNPVFVPGLSSYRNWHQNEFDWFFKDDYKVTPSLTLNLGVRWELYLSPKEVQGHALQVVGGGGGIFGASGSGYAGTLFNPNATGGTPTLFQEIGPNTANPGAQIWNTNYKNFAPALGLAWAVPGQGMWKGLSGGPNKMNVRMGYGIAYERFPLSYANILSGLNPGLSQSVVSLAPQNLSQVQLPLLPSAPPLSLTPSIGPGSHALAAYGIQQDLRTPYVQNYNVTITRELPSALVLSVGFVGSKGSEILGTVNLNEANIIENGILQAYNTVLAGGDSPLIDKIFSNSYPAVAAAGSGSKYVLGSSSTLTYFVNHNPAGFANFISSTTALSGVAGGLLANAGLPLNFVVTNPQFASADYTGNVLSSTYNSLQVSLNKRLAHGFTIQSSYVWSQALGNQQTFRTLRNLSLDKTEQAYDFANVYKINGLYELPFGKGKLIGGNANGFLNRIIGGWQIGAIALAQSGQPLQFTATNGFNLSTNGTPDQVGPIPGVGVQRVGSGIQYFSGFTQITDPGVATLPTSLQALSSLKAIANASGSPILINPPAGQMGTMGLTAMHGPGYKTLNANLIKRIRINERFNIQLQGTAQNLTNTPIFGNPVTSIDSTTFGRITAVGAGASPSIGQIAAFAGSGGRIVVLQARVNF